MESIVYKPHCGKCGHLIDPNEYEVGYRNTYFPVRGILGYYTDISPCACPYCGALFDSIVKPQPKKYQDLYMPR